MIILMPLFRYVLLKVILAAVLLLRYLYKTLQILSFYYLFTLLNLMTSPFLGPIFDWFFNWKSIFANWLNVRNSSYIFLSIWKLYLYLFIT